MMSFPYETGIGTQPRASVGARKGGAFRWLAPVLALALAALMASLVRSPSALGPAVAPSRGELAGRVIDLVSEEPLMGVRVSAGEDGAYTDTEGRYRLSLPAGRYHVRAEAAGYIGMTQAFVQVQGATTQSLDWKMAPQDPDEEASAIIDAKLRQLAQDLPEGEQARALSDGFGISAITEVPATLRVLMTDGSVVTMSLEEYLRGVVPSEMPASWPAEALRAQAVAARSYASTRRAHAGVGADICTTTHCQVWKSTYYDSTDRAIADTRGVVGRYNGNIIYAYFFGHCDGHTRNNENVWVGSPVAYLRGVPCICGYTTMWGHGVGMCQEGARAMANRGYGYVDILKHYYTGIDVPPRLSLLSPRAGQALRGVVLPQVVGGPSITRLTYYVDGVQRADGGGSLAWYWNTTDDADGRHTLRVVASDALGQAEAIVQVWVDNTPPTGSVSTSVWSRTTQISATVSGSDATAIQFSNGWAWEGETLPHWANTAQVVADATASGGLALAGLAGQNVPGAWYGPYTCALPPQRDYAVFYRLKTTNRALDVGLLTMDIADAQGARLYGERPLAAQQFARSNIYEEFALPLAYGAQAPTCATPDGGDGIEFRTWYSGRGDLYLDRVAAYSAAAPLSPAMTALWELPAVEGTHTVAVRLRDAAGNHADRAVSVGLDLTPPQWVTVTMPSVWVRDSVSGLDPATAAWAASIDGARTWSSWESLSLQASIGVTSALQLAPPQALLEDAVITHVRYRIRDVAGHWAESAALPMPLDLEPRIRLPMIRVRAAAAE
jgi:hypothetical protein